MWRILAKTVGEKSGIDNKESDKIAIARLLFFVVVPLITNLFIVAGVIRHW